MSGDLRAKKNIRKELSKSTSAGLNKRNRAKGVSQFQHDSPGVYEVSHESDDLDQAEDVFPNKKSNSETEDEEDRAVKVKVNTAAYYHFKLSDFLTLRIFRNVFEMR